MYLKVISVVAFVTVMLLVPWDQFGDWSRGDRLQYVGYFLYEQSIFEYKDLRDALDYFVNEALWHYLIIFLVRTQHIPIEVVFGAITLFCLGCFAAIVVKRHGAAATLLLVNPLVVDFAFQQLRLALAYSLLLMAYLLRMRVAAIILTAGSVFIHTATIIFVAAYLVIVLLLRRMPSRPQRGVWIYLMLCGLGLAVALAVGPLREAILGYFGDRRALYGAANSTLLYSSYWVVLLGLMGFQDKEYFHDEVNCYSTFILAVVAFSLITGGYTLRFLSVGLPMIMSSMLSMKGSMKWAALYGLLVYVAFQWSYWLQSGFRL
jgi:hypothetical protein